jgi:hypothetical protein
MLTNTPNDDAVWYRITHWHPSHPSEAIHSLHTATSSLCDDHTSRTQYSVITPATARSWCMFKQKTRSTSTPTLQHHILDQHHQVVTSASALAAASAAAAAEAAAALLAHAHQPHSQQHQQLAMLHPAAAKTEPDTQCPADKLHLTQPAAAAFAHPQQYWHLAAAGSLAAAAAGRLVAVAAAAACVAADHLAADLAAFEWGQMLLALLLLLLVQLALP